MTTQITPAQDAQAYDSFMNLYYNDRKNELKPIKEQFVNSLKNGQSYEEALVPFDKYCETKHFVTHWGKSTVFKLMLEAN